MTWGKKRWSQRMKLFMANTPKSDGPLTAANGTGNGAVRAERFHMAWGLGREDDAARHRRHLHSCPFTVISSYCTVFTESHGERRSCKARDQTRARDATCRHRIVCVTCKSRWKKPRKELSPIFRMKRNPYRARPMSESG